MLYKNLFKHGDTKNKKTEKSPIGIKSIIQEVYGGKGDTVTIKTCSPEIFSKKLKSWGNGCGFNSLQGITVPFSPVFRNRDLKILYRTLPELRVFSYCIRMNIVKNMFYQFISSYHSCLMQIIIVIYCFGLNGHIYEICGSNGKESLFF